MEPSPADPGICPLAVRDTAAAASLLAHAFRDNPLNVAVIRSRDPERRLRCNLHGMRALLPAARAHGTLLAARAGGALLGVLVATPPFGYPLPAPPLSARARALLGQGLGVGARWARVFRALDALHPREPHGYLGLLGVDPPAQGGGVGSALLAAWLARHDRDGVPAYLETDRSENVNFYARAGFDVVGETRVLGVRIWRMWRPARTPVPAADTD